MVVASGIALLASAPSLSHAQTFGYSEPFKQVTLSFPEVGVIHKLNVKEGSQVEAEQVLAQLDVSVLEKDLGIAREQLSFKQKRYDQLSKLAQDQHASPEEVEKALSEFTVQKLVTERIESQIEARTIRAPFPGEIVSVRKELYESVSSTQTPVITLVQLDKLYVVLNIPAAEARKYKEGQEISLRFLDPKMEAPAKIDFISPVIDPASGTVRFKVLIPNEAHKFPSGAKCTLGG